MSDLYTAVAHIHDAHSFRIFVARLRAEAEENAETNGPFPTENYNIGDILDSVSGWSTTDEARQIDTANPWAAAARILLAGHYHE